MPDLFPVPGTGAPVGRRRGIHPMTSMKQAAFANAKTTGPILAAIERAVPTNSSLQGV